MNTTQESTTLCTPTSWSRTGQTEDIPFPSPAQQTGPIRSCATVARTLPSLRFAAALAKDLGLSVPNQWLEVADRIKVPFDSEQNFHPEFDGYEQGEWY